MAARVVVITGITGGIGAQLGRTLMRDGWFVIGIDRQTPKELSTCCNDFVAFDLARCREEVPFSSCLEAIRNAAANLPISALVNNAAVQYLAKTSDITLSEWDESLTVNLTAPLRLSQALAPQLAAQHGIILNIGSVHAQATKKEFVAYAASKSALHGLTRALAVDLGPEIRVVCLAPAAVATPMLQAGFAGREEAFADLQQCHALERIAEPVEIADAASFLLSNRARFFSGATLFLDGGVLSRLHDPA